MIKVYQIILGEIPEYLVACVESVKRWCERAGNKYNQISTIPERLSWVPGITTGYFRNRLIKDWLVLDLLSCEENIMVVDWDIFLYSAHCVSINQESFSFLPNQYPTFAGSPMDCMMYNAGNITAFHRMREFAGDIKTVQPGELLLAKVIRLYIQENPSFKNASFNHKQYKHLCNCHLVQ